ncbi:MAG: hypothetical protein RLZZ142_875 [Verrucomicrobiota bacterium]
MGYPNFGLTPPKKAHFGLSHPHPASFLLPVHLRLLRLTGGGDDSLGIVGVFGVLAEMGFDGLQDRGVRQGLDPGAEGLLEFARVEIAFGELDGAWV